MRELQEVRREVVIDAPPEEVWRAVATEEGREDWLEDHEDREILVETADPPRRLVWWWGQDEQESRRVEVRLIPAGTRTRVIVTEAAPEFPLASLRASLLAVAA